MKKTMKVVFFVFFASCLAGSLSAQERLKRVLEQAEASNAQVTYGSGNGGEQVVRVIRIENDVALIDNVVAAFEADKKNAGSASESSANGQVTSFECSFEADGKESVYRFNRRSRHSGELIFLHHPKGLNPFINTGSIRIDTEQLRRQVDSLRNNIRNNVRNNIRNNFDSEQMDSMKREVARSMEEYKAQLQEAVQRLQQQLLREQLDPEQPAVRGGE